MLCLDDINHIAAIIILFLNTFVFNMLITINRNFVFQKVENQRTTRNIFELFGKEPVTSRKEKRRKKGSEKKLRHHKEKKESLDDY